MPHCILEYSGNIADSPDWQDLLLKINHALAGTGLFTLADIKSRAVRHEHFAVGDGDSSRAFVTLSVAILSGRDDDTKRRIAETMTAVLDQAFPLSRQRLKLSLTVQIADIHRESYQRRSKP